jgi:Synaptobrevin
MLTCAFFGEYILITLYRLQNQVDEVVDIMQTNIGKVMDRGEKLEDLQDKSGLCC